ncbi:MAG TPA: hypothetical protein ENO33_04050 [Hydrogenobaculum sp.]|nr:hypothetical protein [Hydrogenobaculum sp.]
MVSALFLFSCASSTESYDYYVSSKVSSLVGANLSKLIEEFGPPSSVVKLKNGSRIFSYIFVKRYVYPSTCTGYSYYFGVVDCFPPEVEERKFYANFWVDKNDKIYKAEFSNGKF